MVAKLDIKINQLTNQIRQYGDNKRNNIQSGKNSNKNNQHNSKSALPIKKVGGGGSGGIIYRGNTYFVVNKNNLQVNPGTISKGCLS